MADRPVLLVTGGGRGIGAATCRKAAAAGFDVVVNYVRDATAAEALVAELRGMGARAEAYQADVSKDEDIAALFAKIDERFGRLTHFVCNAGMTGRVGRLDDADPAMLRQVVDLNVTGALLTLQAAVKRMSTRHGGSGGAIVILSSVAARLGSANDFVWYAASKGAMDSLTVGLAREVAGEGIRVNAVSPGMIDTEIHATAGDPGRAERAVAAIPARRVGSAEEVAEAIMYLLSESASYVMGGNLDVSGGR
ncbi:NAD(P)-dependent oxidoreductase [Acuticoccus sediminis]|uniref:NAD(P)-dependent oxidoreductase n=1 Tax=Acuticoccus sediminis TaxID=2184697 RepID=A0A8B2NRY2_9HYPH|nr:SDR family oxidoreductase [Acuticoccus sediminis]RAI02988.1 NAD(P)-dependent oxidoreductase [Acuticoccus sediminis]